MQSLSTWHATGQVTSSHCVCLSVCLSVTHTHLFNSPFSGTTQVSRYQKGDWQWHQLGHMQVCTSLQTDNHASTPPLSFFTGRMPFLQPNQQRQSTEQPVSVCLSQVSVLLKCRDMQCLSTRRAAGQITSRTHQCYGPVSVCLSVCLSVCHKSVLYWKRFGEIG